MYMYASHSLRLTVTVQKIYQSLSHSLSLSLSLSLSESTKKHSCLKTNYELKKFLVGKKWQESNNTCKRH